MSDQLHPEHVAGKIGGFVGRARQLDAAAFAAATGMDLRFDDYDRGMRPKAVGRLARFILGEDNFAAGSSNAIAGEDRFGLVFVNLHRGSVFRSTLKQSASIRILPALET